MTQAIILAAGQGTRLRPLTDNLPKCLVPLAGKSLLERQVEVLNAQSIDCIKIATGYCAEKIVAMGFDTVYNEKFTTTNMVASLFVALDFIQSSDDDLVISYGDIVYQAENLAAMLASPAEIALMIDTRWLDLWSLRLDNPLEDAETLIMDSEGYVTQLGKKPLDYSQIEGQYTGLIKVAGKKRRDLVAHYRSMNKHARYDGKDFDNMYMTSFLQSLIDSGWRAKAVMVENGWLEIDSVDDLACYESLADRDELSKFYRLST